MLVTQSRPRNLKWFHAGPLLYGDWGTSRLYVLGLAFFYTANESVLFLLAIALLMGAVAWAYTIICRSFPDGGGVYTAARQINPTLSVVGATLLLCGYIITVAISVVEALHYFGVHDGPVLVGLAILIIVLIGGVNWLGAKSAGTFALVIAFAAVAIALVMAVLVIRYLPDGLSRIHLRTGQGSGIWPHWTSFTQIVLALAGVEAVANMTGLMKKPVERTAKRTIWPVLAEVVLLNIVFGIAMTGMFSQLPELAGITGALAAVDPSTLSPEALATTNEIKHTAMELIARIAATDALGTTVGAIFGKVAAIVFGLLLLSATNTAIMAMVSVLFAMGRDRELPRALTRLNYSGVPWIAVIVSCVIAIMVVLVERRPEKLAELYIIGVCGAITVSLLSTAFNKKLKIKKRDRIGLHALGIFLTAISLTIVVTKPNATIFAGIVIGGVLVLRIGLQWQARRHPEPVAEPDAGWLGELARKPVDLDPSKPRIMLAARGRYQSEFAVDLAKRRDGILFAIFVRTLRVMDLGPGQMPRLESDPDAQEALGTTAVLAREAGVPFVPIYVTAANIADEILDHTVTYGNDTLIMGKSKRSLFSRKVTGDVIAQVADALPDGVVLITRSAQTPHHSTTPTGHHDIEDDEADSED